MVVCDLEPEGSAPWELLRKYGGKFSFFQKIKMGGVGSPKIVYHAGLKEVDKFVEETAGSDIPYLNFEYLKNGLLARINKTQYLKGVLINFDEIETIELSTQQKVTQRANNAMVKDKINVGSGRLEIMTTAGEQLICEVPFPSYRGVLSFFTKNKSMRGKFSSNLKSS